MPTPIPPPPVPPKIPTGRELYDALMNHFEPDLTTQNVKALQEKYKDETPEQRVARMQRYELAFERCDTAYDEYMHTLDTQMKRYRHESFSHVELEDRSSDENLLGSFDPLFNQAAA